MASTKAHTLPRTIPSSYLVNVFGWSRALGAKVTCRARSAKQDPTTGIVKSREPCGPLLDHRSDPSYVSAEYRVDTSVASAVSSSSPRPDRPSQVPSPGVWIDLPFLAPVDDGSPLGSAGPILLVSSNLLLNLRVPRPLILLFSHSSRSSCVS